MASTYSARVSAIIEGIIGVGQLGTLKPQLALNKSLPQGTSSWNVNKIFFQEKAITTADVLNLGDGSLKDINGVSMVFTKVLVMAIINEDTTTGILTVGANGTNPWESWSSAGATVPIGPEALFLTTNKAGFAVTTGASDRLKINPSGPITYAIALLGQG